MTESKGVRQSNRQRKNKVDLLDKSHSLLYNDLVNIREADLTVEPLIPSRESAGKIRHNSHCRDEAAKATPMRQLLLSHASQSEGLPNVYLHIPWAKEGREQKGRPLRFGEGSV